jgi:acyl-homoserine-lactone acylase
MSNAVARRRRVLAFSSAIAAALVVIGCSGSDGGPDPVPPKPLPNPTTAAEIRRTSYGIPHIISRTEKGLGYGIGYAYAQDNFCVLADEIVTINGERSRWFGAEGANIYGLKNLTADFYFKLINDDAAADDTWNRQSAEVKARFEGYVLGVNRYLAEKGVANLAADCKGQPWVRPITVRDMAKLVRRLSVQASGVNFIDAMYAAQPPATVVGAAAARAKPATQMARAAKQMLAATEGPLSKAYWDGQREQFGSNALALGSEATETGRGMLFGNPHFPWFGILRFYQMHLTIPDKMDVMGAALNGFPGINIGFTNEFAWSHTVNTSAHFTLYALQLDPANPTRYAYDGQTRDMTKKTLTVQVRQANGSVVPVTRTYYGSSHGPIVVIPGQLAWDKTLAFAFRDANLENWRLAEHWLRKNRAQNLAEFKAVVEGVVGNPWTNTIAVDRAGNTYYANVTPVPHVDTAKENACVAAPFKPLIAASGLFVLAGSTSACEWTVDPTSPQPGTFAGKDLPTLSRKDFVHNANDSAWLSNPAVPMTGFPKIVSLDSYEQNGRTRIGLAQAQARLAGTDGRPGSKFSMDVLREIVLSNRVYYAEVALTDALDVMCAGDPSHTVDGQTVDLGKACGVLKNWDRRAELQSVGVPLFEAFWTRARSSSIWAVPFNATDPVNTPRGIVKGNAAVTKSLRDALARAVISQAGAGIPIDRPWYEIQVATKSLPLPIHGGNGTPLGIYNAISSSVIGSRLPGARAVTNGSSYIQTVTWDDGGPKVGAFLTYSNSTDAASPYYADQTYRFYLKDWIRLPFTNEEVTTDPNFTSIVISEPEAE